MRKIIFLIIFFSLFSYKIYADSYSAYLESIKVVANCLNKYNDYKVCEEIFTLALEDVKNHG